MKLVVDHLKTIMGTVAAARLEVIDMKIGTIGHLSDPQAAIAMVVGPMEAITIHLTLVEPLQSKVVVVGMTSFSACLRLKIEFERKAASK